MNLATLTLTAALLAPTPLGLPATSDAAHQLQVSVAEVAPSDPRMYVMQRASRSGWRGQQWRCIDALVYRESSWRINAKNAHSSAYGLFQFLHMKPGTPLAKQYATFEDYINSRYHADPCAALHHSITKGWY